jgi:hypothetical protein
MGGKDRATIDMTRFDNFAGNQASLILSGAQGRNLNKLQPEFLPLRSKDDRIDAPLRWLRVTLSR